MRFATRAKVVKVKPSLNEIKSEKSSIEFYKNQIKKLEEELKSRKNTTEEISAIKSVKSEKEILEYIMKTNESLNNELVNYKEMYESEKEKNKSIVEEINKLKAIVNPESYGNNIFNNSQNHFSTTGNQYNSNNNLPSVNHNENYNYFNNLLSNNTDQYHPSYLNDYNSPSNANNYNTKQFNHSLSNQNTYGNNNKYNHDNMNQYINNISNVPSNAGIERPQYWDIKQVSKLYNTEMIGRNQINELISVRSEDAIVDKAIDPKSTHEEPIIDNLISKVNKVVEHDPKKSSWNEQSLKILSNYKADIHTVQNKYRDMLKDACYKIFPKSTYINEIFQVEEVFHDTKDDIIAKISNGTIFKDIRFMYQINMYDQFENNIRNLKEMYEDRIDTLEKNMDFYKTYIENYYRKKIQNTRTAKLDNIDFINMDESPIMMITSEHNDKLKSLRELYDVKMKELEQVFLLIIGLFR